MGHSVLDGQHQSVRYDFLSNPWAARKALQGFTLAVLATSVGILPAFVVDAGHGVRAPVSTTVTAARLVTVKAPAVADRANQTSVVDLREVPESESLAGGNRTGTPAKSGRVDDSRAGYRPPPVLDAVDSPVTGTASVGIAFSPPVAFQEKSFAIGTSMVEPIHPEQPLVEPQHQLSPQEIDRQERRLPGADPTGTPTIVTTDVDTGVRLNTQSTGSATPTPTESEFEDAAGQGITL